MATSSRSHRSRICDWKGDHYSKERTRPGLLAVAGRQTRGPGLDEAEVRAVLMPRASMTNDARCLSVLVAAVLCRFHPSRGTISVAAPLIEHQ